MILKYGRSSFSADTCLSTKDGSLFSSLAYETIVTVGVRLAGGIVNRVAWFTLLLVGAFIIIACNASTHDWFAGQASIA